MEALEAEEEALIVLQAIVPLGKTVLRMIQETLMILRENVPTQKVVAMMEMEMATVAMAVQVVLVIVKMEFPALQKVLLVILTLIILPLQGEHQAAVAAVDPVVAEAVEVVPHHLVAVLLEVAPAVRQVISLVHPLVVTYLQE